MESSNCPAISTRNLGRAVATLLIISLVAGLAVPNELRGQSAGPTETTKKDKAREFIILSYTQLMADVAKGSGNYQTSLLGLLEVAKNEEAAAIRRIKAMSEAFPNIAQFADQVTDAFIKPAAVIPGVGQQASAISGSRLPRSGTVLPQIGDTWTYRLTEPKRLDGPKQRSYVVKVASVSGSEIRDELFLDNVSAGLVVHSNGSYLVAQGVSIFSPYLNVFQQPFVRVGEIAILDQVACKYPYGCTAKSTFVSPEKIRVPAGSFETIKVIIEHSWYPDMTFAGNRGARLWGSRTLTIWYSRQLKRAVKFLSQPVSGSIPPIDPDFVLELVSYQLN